MIYQLHDEFQFSMDPKITEAIAQYKRNLEKLGVRVAELILFGSHAKGTAGEESDIDLLVISEDLKKFDLLDRLCLLGRARMGIYHSMEILGATPEEYKNAAPGSFLHDEIQAKGIAV